MNKPLFPLAIIEAANTSEKDTGVRSCITLAQWALESGYGRHMPIRSNNPFGIKARPGQPYVEASTKEFQNGKWITVVARFRKFDSIADAFVHHARLLCSGPYKVALKYRADWRKFLQRIAPIYATDPKYFQKIESIICQYKLADHDLSLLLPPPAKSWDEEEGLSDLL